MASKSKPTLKIKKIWDNNGLLSSGVDYEFSESGHIDWKSMVLKKTDLLMPNRSWFFGREPESPKNVADMENPKEEQLALTLRATQWLLNARGYTNIEYNPICRISEGDKDIAVYSCKITFRGNYETDFEEVSYEAIASATESNTSGYIAQSYLDSTAQNRALSRAVRGFLGVHIVSDEEMGNVAPQGDVSDDGGKKLSFHTTLEKLWSEKNDGAFSTFVEFMVGEGLDITCSGWEDMSGKNLREALGILKKMV
tara:strand:- start:56 stop:817 length:762 start_codon:yes stop_codon:yes gene_type:complete